MQEVKQIQLNTLPEIFTCFANKKDLMLHMRLNICSEGFVRACVTTSVANLYLHGVCVRVLRFFLPRTCACSISPFSVHSKNAPWLEIEVMIVSVPKKQNTQK